jgi:hypothetical protein
MTWPWRCWVWGHRWALVLDEGHVFLECATCAAATPGWWTPRSLIMQVHKRRTDAPAPLTVDPVFEDCLASKFKTHRFSVSDPVTGQRFCQFCGRSFTACLKPSEWIEDE